MPPLKNRLARWPYVISDIKRHSNAGPAHRVLRLIKESHPLRPSTMEQDKSKQPILITAGGKIVCRRCQAVSKRTGKQCGAAADRLSKRSKCKWHGGRSTGPKTEEGRAKCATVRIVHGNSTREKRKQNAVTATKLLLLRDLGINLGIFGSEPIGWPGRPPNLYCAAKKFSVEELVKQIEFLDTVFAYGCPR